ncbi:MAG: hypothetical protein ETSY1_40095 [Candidatus Entotheonella factor]|uniref:Uncharacterized protein n=1 Tax=Entotheonella factor TaxID=1429438 RepID=W4L552_ENTF1|nr:MAG: hypothetical protein ETSY1_40095 [Candidatus Entotheonella factor]
MRSPWYLAVVIWIGLGIGCAWSAALSVAASAESQWPRVAQADGPTIDLPDIVGGPQNPQMTLDINDGIADLTALQVTVTAPSTRDIIIDTVTIGFGLPFGDEVTTGNESFLDELRARLIIEDVEVNGVQDDGEVPEGMQSIRDLEDPATVMFPLNPPLSLAADTAATLLVIIDINQPATQSAAATPWRQAAMAQWYHAAAWLLLPIIGFVSYVSRSAPNLRRRCLIALMLLGFGLLLAGCPGGDDDNELRFVVNLPSNGLVGEGQRLGPDSAIAGTTIRLMR